MGERRPFVPLSRRRPVGHLRPPLFLLREVALVGAALGGVGHHSALDSARRGPGADDTRRAVPTGDRDGQRRRDAGPLVVAGYERSAAGEPDAAAAPDGRSVPAGRRRQCLSAVEAPHGVAGPQPAFHQVGPVDEILDAGGRCVHGGALVLGRRPGLPHESAPIYSHVLWCIAMKRKLVKIGEASRLLGTSPAQLRKWDVSGDLRPARRTRGGTRYYAVADLVSTAPGVVADGPTTICYAWVSGPGQEVELDRQEALMAAYCIGQGWSTWVVLDHGAGPELRELVELVLYRQVERLVVADGVDLPSFGRALLTTICEAQGVEVVVAQPVDRQVVIEPLPDGVLAEPEPAGVAGTWQPSLLG